MLSFDDGCHDFIDYAVPILERRRVRVNHNLIVNAVERGETPWMIKLVDALATISADQVQALRVPGLNRRPHLADDSAKARFGAQLTGHLKGLTATERAEQFPEITELVAHTDPARFTRMLSRAEIEPMIGEHEWGAHSVDHENMARLGDAEFLEQLALCEAMLDRMGSQMDVFAFPNGKFRWEQVDVLRARGVRSILLVGDRPARLDERAYTRINLYGDSAAEIRLRAAGHHVPGGG